MKTTSTFFLLLLMLLTSTILSTADIPYLTGRVTDNAQILSEETRQSLTETLKGHEERTSNQIAILTVPTINGKGIEEYAVEVFEAWKLGQKGNDNGLLIVIVPDDRRMRIEVGYGLEGTLTDGMAGQIIRSVITPRFKNGDYNGGITDGVSAIINVLEGGELSNVISNNNASGESSGFNFQRPDIPIIPLILIGTFIFSILGIFTMVGITTPGMGWFLYVFLIPFWAGFPIFILGTSGAFILLVTYIIGFPIAKLTLKNTAWYKKANKDLRIKGRASIGGFRSSSRSSSRSWSSGSSFSGGGGSSGGGGASGSW